MENTHQEKYIQWLTKETTEAEKALQSKAFQFESDFFYRYDAERI
jgi:hypothetical protein